MPNEYELDINKLTVQNKLLNQRFNYYMQNNIPDAQNIIFQITPDYSSPRKVSSEQLDISGGSLLGKALLILGIITGTPVTMKTLPEVLSKIKTGDIDVGIENAPDFFKTYLQAKIENKEKYLNKKDDDLYDKIKLLISRIENNPKYNESIKSIIEDNLKKLKENKHINIDILN